MALYIKQQISTKALNNSTFIFQDLNLYSITNILYNTAPCIELQISATIWTNIQINVEYYNVFRYLHLYPSSITRHNISNTKFPLKL